jgi:hypothetical protein
VAQGDGDQPPAGWYDDPGAAGQLRWWDGSAWTEHTRAVLPPTTDAGGAGSPAAGRTWPPTTGGGSWGSTTAATWTGERVDPWLWQSILVTLFCCQPFGIVAIVFAAQSQSALSSGDVATARDKAATARTWVLASLAVWAVLLGFGALFVLFGAAF